MSSKDYTPEEIIQGNLRLLLEKEISVDKLPSIFLIDFLKTRTFEKVVTVFYQDLYEEKNILILKLFNKEEETGEKEESDRAEIAIITVKMERLLDEFSVDTDE